MQVGCRLQLGKAHGYIVFFFGSKQLCPTIVCVSFGRKGGSVTKKKKSLDALPCFPFHSNARLAILAMLCIPLWFGFRPFACLLLLACLFVELQNVAQYFFFLIAFGSFVSFD